MTVVLRGRGEQLKTLDGLLADARAGRSRVLVVRGDPGIGKTALLSYTADSAPDFRVIRAEGVQSEMELPFAALHQLCASLMNRSRDLPGPQRDALDVAFGLRSGSPPDRFLVGLAVLSLLSDAAAEQPVLCLIDDAQWLDRASAQALGFAARRLLAEPVALLVAAREPGGEFTALPELVIEGLRESDARELLGLMIIGPLDERVRDRILAEAAGNPLALLELPRALTPAELAGGFGEPGAAGLSGRIEDSFLRRLQALPVDTRRLLLVAAAEPAGDAVLVWRAAERLGIGVAAAAPAEADGLLAIGARVIFRHPLVRSAVYRAAPASERRLVHQALAYATDPRSDPDRHAWHRAQATLGPDEEVAAELENSAGRAQARGGLAAAAAFLERSVALTLDPSHRAERALAAAQAKYQAGAFDAALGLLADADAGPLNEFGRARAALLRGQIAFGSRSDSEAPQLLLTAARQLEPLDARLARDTYLEALYAAIWAGRLASGVDMREVAEAARAAPVPQPARAPDLLLDGMAVLITEGYPSAVAPLKRAVRAFRYGSVSEQEELRWLWPATHAARDVWDYEAWDALSARQVKLDRDAGALIALTPVLSSRALAPVLAGEFTVAASMVAEVESITEATDSSIAPFGALGLAALRGREAEAFDLIETCTKDAERRREGAGLVVIEWATAVLCNGLGRYEQALAAAQRASQNPTGSSLANWALVELVEAAVHDGVPERAVGAVQQLSQVTGACGTDWALGVEARSRALVSGGEAAESLYREAVGRLGRTPLRLDLARARLLYGEWLRRRNRRADAREQLRAAHQMLASMGAAGFAERAARELRATGDRIPGGTTGSPGRLTAREAQIAQLAHEGLSNPDIAAQLFLSPRTVEYHLHKIFTKLGISSRNQLHSVLADGARQAPARAR